jgi:glutamate dehydrogenase (NADP+)
MAVDPRELSKAELEAVARGYAHYLAPYIGSDKDIPAPDVNTNAEIIDWMLDEYEHTAGKKDPGAFTGKSMAKGGSEGRPAATGRGGVIVLIEYLKAQGILDKPFTVALQGFGNVGYFFAKVLQEECPKAKLIAVSNSKNTWVHQDGIDVTKTTDGQETPRPEHLADLQGVAPLPHHAVHTVEADVLVLAALEDAVTEDNVDEIKAQVIVELANGPVTQQAEPKLLERHVAILPDVVANAGGVIVSCLEWEQNLAGEHWAEAEVNKKLADILVPAANFMLERATQKASSYKHAAFELALERLLG